MAFRISEHKTPIFLCGNEEQSFVEIMNCRLGKRGFVLCGNDESSCVGTRNCLVWERRLFSFGNDKSLCLATKEEGNEEIINNNNIEWLDNEIEYKDSTTFMIIIITISSTVLVASVLGIGLLVFYCKRVKVSLLFIAYKNIYIFMCIIKKSGLLSS